MGRRGFGPGFGIFGLSPRGGGGGAAPSDITLTGGNVPDSAPDNRYVGTLTTTDGADATEHTYTLIDNDGGRFKLVGNELRSTSTAILYSAGTTRSVTVRSTNATGQTFDKVLTITVVAPIVFQATAFNGSTDYYQYGAAISRAGSWAIFGQFVWNPDAGGTSVEYIYSGGGALAGNDTVHIGVNEPSSGTNPSKMFARVKSGTNTQQTFTGSTGPALVVGRTYAFGLVRNTSGTQNLSLYLYDLSTQTFTETTIESKSPGAQLNDFTEATAGRAGQRSNGTGNFKGTIHAIQHVIGAPNAAQRLQLAKGRSFSEVGLTARAAHFFDDATAATITDLSGNGNTSTKVGAPTATTIALPQRTNSEVTLTPVGFNAVFQRDDTTGPVPMQGTYFGAPASPAIWGRMIYADTKKEVKGWTSLGTSTGGAFDYSLLGVPVATRDGEPVWCIREVHYGNQRFTDTFNSGVGEVHVFAGQSNMARMIEQNDYTVTPSAYAGYVSGADQNWSAIASAATIIGTNSPVGPGEGVATFVNALIAELKMPVAVINTAVGGTSMAQWTQTSGALYVNMKACILRNTINGKIGGWHWNQGEFDTGAGAPTDYSARLTFLSNMLTWLAADITVHATRPWFFVRSLGYVEGSVVQAAWSGIRRADFQITLDQPAKAAWAGNTMDALNFGGDMTNLHFDDYRLHARRQAVAVLTACGVAGYSGSTGARVASVTAVNTTTTDVTFTLASGATALSTIGGGNPTGFQVSQDDFVGQLSISATSLTGPTVRLTHAAQTSGTRKVRYEYSAAPVRTNLLRDNYTPLGDSGRLAEPILDPVTAV